MSDTVLVVDDAAAGAELTDSGCRVERARWFEAIGRAHDVSPDAFVFVKPGADAMLVAKTLGWVHGRPVLLVDASEADLKRVPGALRVVSSRERLGSIVRSVLRR